MNVAARATLGTTSVEVTRLGLGTAPLGNLYAAVADDVARGVVDAALDAGVGFVDTAPFYGYGLSERRVGDALRAHGARRGHVVLSTKVGRLLAPRREGPAPSHGFVDTLPFVPVFDYSRDAVVRSFEDSLQRLGVDRIDVLFAHDVGRLTHRDDHDRTLGDLLAGGLPALHALKGDGLVGAIGIGVNETEVCLEILKDADLDVILLAGRYTLLDQRAQDDLLPVCARRGVSVVLGGPYNSGILATEPCDDATYDYARAPADVVARARRLHEVCRAHGVSVSAAALQFPLHHPVVASVIPGARHAAEVEENVARFATAIPAALWRDLKAAGLVRADAPVESS